MSGALDDGVAELWQAFLDGGLDDAQMAALEARLSADPALAALAAERYVEHRLLTLALQREEPGRFAQATQARLHAGSDDFARRIQSRITSVAHPALDLPARRLGWSHYAFAASAAALVALAV